jgi:hypothetical protein
MENSGLSKQLLRQSRHSSARRIKIAHHFLLSARQKILEKN